jgi:3-hydroxyisobutyrate dehydrogenase-like beta-hydroxyacid dehydrogenase
MTSDATVTIGLLHPGEMGSSIGAVARASGARVIWVSEDRSDGTRARAEADGFEDVSWLNAVVNQSRIIVSVCPPEFATEVASEVQALGFRGIYVDANAIAPATSRHVEEIVAQNGGSYVDGGIIGAPARQPGTTRLYLSGEQAGFVAQFLDKGDLEVICIEGDAGAASAVKMAYAAWTKGTSALLADIHALALAEGVHGPLMAEWQRSQPELLARSDRGLASAAAKAWRFAGEMDEIAATFAADGLPDGFHRAAADVYRRLAGFKDDPDAPGGAALAQHLLPPR